MLQLVLGKNITCFVLTDHVASEDILLGTIEMLAPVFPPPPPKKKKNKIALFIQRMCLEDPFSTTGVDFAGPRDLSSTECSSNLDKARFFSGLVLLIHFSVL